MGGIDSKGGVGFKKESMSMKKKAKVSPNLIALPLLNKKKRNLLSSVLERQRRVCSVQTRAMVERERRENEIEKELLEEEQVGQYP